MPGGVVISAVTVDAVESAMPDLTHEEFEKEMHREMRAHAIARWGEDRLPLIEETLAKAAASVASMSTQNFDVSDSPGFTLAEFAWIDDEDEPEGADA